MKSFDRKGVYEYIKSPTNRVCLIQKEIGLVLFLDLDKRGEMNDCAFHAKILMEEETILKNPLPVDPFQNNQNLVVGLSGFGTQLTKSISQKSLAVLWV